MPFLDDDFLLRTETARRLYHETAAALPVIDYHNHLPPAEIAADRRFDNLYEAWLEGDHYKWRAMRANGIPERLCTGDAPPHEKFLAWARTVPHTLRNPLYHWTHLELRRTFGIESLLDERTAPGIWDQTRVMLAGSDLSTQGLLRRFRVAALCTTDDPTDDLAPHRALAASGCPTRVYPAFRPDRAIAVDRPEAWNPWVDRLAEAAGLEIRTLSDLEEALDRRHAYFHELGGRLSDHGLSHCPLRFPPESEAAAIFAAARRGTAATPEEQASFAAHLMVFFGRLDAARGWTKQLHLGPLRNVSSRAFQQLGPDTGFDSIGDFPQAQGLAGYLDRLDREGALPRVVLYNNNPADNYVFATMIGNFQDGITPGKVQWGSGWWYLDAKDGIRWQLNALSTCGLLSRFIGMLTDSRSFLSFPRHEYFRRILCDLIGTDIERGEMPDDDGLVRPLIRNICYDNARAYLGLDVPPAEEVP